MSFLEEIKKLKERINSMPTLALLREVGEELEKDSPLKLEILKIYKEEMIRRKFNSPFGFLVNVTKNESEEVDLDKAKQSSYFRRIATMKKYALYSTQIALASLRIRECLIKNNYQDLIEFLPLNGNHLGNVLKFGYAGMIVYRGLYEIMRGYGEEVEIEVYEIEGEGYFYKKVKKKDLELNEGEKVVRISKKKSIKSLFLSKFVVRALASAITSYAFSIALEELNEGKRLKEYNKVLESRGYPRFYDAREVLEFDKDLKKELEEKGFIRGEELEESIKKELYEFKKKLIKRAEEIAKLMLVVPLAKHYLLKGEGERRVNPLYPNIALNPTKNQIKLFGVANNIVGVELERLVEKKLELEKKLKGKITSKELSLALAKKLFGVKFAKELLKAKEEEINKSYEKLALLGGE